MLSVSPLYIHTDHLKAAFAVSLAKHGLNLAADRSAQTVPSGPDVQAACSPAQHKSSGWGPAILAFVAPQVILFGN